MRTSDEWHELRLDHFEVGFVAHAAATVSDAYAQTMVLTDVAIGRTERVALVPHEATLMVAAPDRARALFPFPCLPDRMAEHGIGRWQ